jgi:ankyrin repeat protein
VLLHEKNGCNLFHCLIQEELAEALKVKFVYILSDAGVDINLKEFCDERTCLHLATMSGLELVVAALLQNGADLTITDKVN